MKKLFVLAGLMVCMFQPLIFGEDSSFHDKNELSDADGTGMKMFGGSILAFGIWTINPYPCVIGIFFLAGGQERNIYNRKRLIAEKEARKTVCRDIKKSMSAMLLDNEKYPLFMRVFTETDCDEEFDADDFDNSGLSIVIKDKNIHLFYNGTVIRKESIPIDDCAASIITGSTAEIMKAVTIDKIKIYRRSCNQLKS